MRKRSPIALLGVLLGLAFAPVKAGENEVYVRVVQVRGSGTRGEKRAEMDKSLEPFRAHLEEASKHARYVLLGKSVVKRGPYGNAIEFELEKGFRAHATASQAAEKHLKLLLQVDKREGKHDEMVFKATLDMKDGATAVQQIEKALEGADLLLAVTASRDPL